MPVKQVVSDKIHAPHLVDSTDFDPRQPVCAAHSPLGALRPHIKPFFALDPIRLVVIDEPPFTA